jgi:hypothetical protein
VGTIADARNFAYLGINNVFEHFVTKQTLGCGHDSPICNFYVPRLCMDFVLNYVLGSKSSFQVHRLMSMTSYLSHKNVGSCVC